MKREHTLKRKLEALAMLGDAIAAMKALSAHHLRAARGELAAARAYRAEVDAIIAAVPLAHRPVPAGPAGVVLLATDLGLCGAYGMRLVEAAGAHVRVAGPGPFYCVGRRPMGPLRRAGVRPVRVYPAATSLRALAPLLLTLADDVLSDHRRGAFRTLDVISARFDGVGAFTARTTRLVPLAPTSARPLHVVTPYAPVGALVAVAVREYLYSTLYELVLDALAAEQGMRLVATQAAEDWLDGRVSQLRRELASARRETSTQEVLDVAGAARQRRVRAARS